MLGLSTLISPDIYGNAAPFMPQVLQLLCALSQRSVEIQIADSQKQVREEQAEEDLEDAAIVEDEDDDCISIGSDDLDDDEWEAQNDDDDEDRNLYESPLDGINEVMFLVDRIEALGKANPQVHQQLLATLSPECSTQLQTSSNWVQEQAALA